MIEVSGVSMTYAPAVTGAADASVVSSADLSRALDNVSCTFAPGEVVSLAGLNGSGKSTLARLLCAMRLADAGTVTVDGVNPAKGESERLQVRKCVGFVQQDPVDQIVSTLVFDEVAFGPRNLGLDEDIVQNVFPPPLRRWGLLGLACAT